MSLTTRAAVPHSDAAAGLGMGTAATTGWTVGSDWESDRRCSAWDRLKGKVSRAPGNRMCGCGRARTGRLDGGIVVLKVVDEVHVLVLPS